jgi:hypothetical protein
VKAIVPAGVAALLCCGTARASAPVRVETSPRLSTRPLHAIRVRVLVEPDEANRAVVAEVDGEHFYRSSVDTLAGAEARREHVFEWRSLVPCGVYQITATTFDRNGRVLHVASDRAYVCHEPDGTP